MTITAGWGMDEVHQRCGPSIELQRGARLLCTLWPIDIRVPRAPFHQLQTQTLKLGRRSECHHSNPYQSGGTRQLQNLVWVLDELVLKQRTFGASSPDPVRESLRSVSPAGHRYHGSSTSIVYLTSCLAPLVATSGARLRGTC